jgi:hypothetical protein
MPKSVTQILQRLTEIQEINKLDYTIYHKCNSFYVLQISQNNECIIALVHPHAHIQCLLNTNFLAFCFTLLTWLLHKLAASLFTLALKMEAEHSGIHLQHYTVLRTYQRTIMTRLTAMKMYINKRILKFISLYRCELKQV